MITTACSPASYWLLSLIAVLTDDSTALTIGVSAAIAVVLLILILLVLGIIVFLLYKRSRKLGKEELPGIANGIVFSWVGNRRK